MPAPATANEFLGLARKGKVLDEQRLAELFPDENDLPADSTSCAAELVKAGLLTPFQAKQLLAGRYLGMMVGTYRLLEPIGQGGMGVVYRAEHVGLKRLAAVKVLPPSKARDRTTLERFLREARSAAALDHPNIVKLFDVGHSAGVHYLALEYVDGITLDRLVDTTGPIHYPTAVHYAVQAAAGLAHAHERGFVHRDIKPGNLMLTRDGTVKILDMGLTRSLDRDEDRLTEQLDSATIIGTVDFISPEQALNVPTDERADIYSLGATLYALLTGRPPFDGNATQKLMQHQVREADRLCDLRPEIPVELSDVVDAMMAKRPEDRIPTAADVIQALAPWLPSVPHTLAFDAAAATGGAITAALTAVRTKRTAPVNRRGGAEPGPAGSIPRWAVWSVLAAAVLLVAGGGAIWVLSEPDPKPPTLAVPVSPPQVPAPPEPTGVQPVKLEGWDDAAERLAVSADGKTLITCGGKGGVGVWDIAGGKLTGRLSGHTATVWAAAVATDGRRVVTASKDGTVRAWDLATLSQVWSYGKPGSEGRAAAFSPDGRTVVASFTGKEGNVVVALAADSGQELKARTGTTCPALDVLPDGRTAALATVRPNAVALWDYETGQVTKQFRLNDADGEVRTIAAAPDGRSLVVGGGPWTAAGVGYLALLDADTGVERARVTAPDRLNAFGHVGFSPSGRHLVACGYGGRVRVWETEGGRQVETFDHAPRPAQLGAALFALNGRAVVSGGRDGSLNLWPLTAATYKYHPLPVGLAATASSSEQVLTHRPPAAGKPGAEGRILMPDWAPRQVGEVPFIPSPPREGGKNVIILRGGHGSLAPQLPDAVRLSTNSPTAAVHLLGACGAWAWPGKAINGIPSGTHGAIALTVRLHYADGRTEDHPLRHGIEYADWTNKDSLPGSQVAVELAGPAKRYLRYMAIRPARPTAVLKGIEFVKSPDDPTAPVVVAVTVEAS